MVSAYLDRMRRLTEFTRKGFVVFSVVLSAIRHLFGSSWPYLHDRVSSSSRRFSKYLTFCCSNTNCCFSQRRQLLRSLSSLFRLSSPKLPHFILAFSRSTTRSHLVLDLFVVVSIHTNCFIQCRQVGSWTRHQSAELFYSLSLFTVNAVHLSPPVSLNCAFIFLQAGFSLHALFVVVSIHANCFHSVHATWI